MERKHLTRTQYDSRRREALSKSMVDFLRRRGIELNGTNKAICPLPGHDEKTPSFSVRNYQGGDRFHCFGCGEKGNLIDLVMILNDRSFKEALDDILRDGGQVSSVPMVKHKQSPTKNESSPIDLARNQKIYSSLLKIAGSQNQQAGMEYMLSRRINKKSYAFFGLAWLDNPGLAFKELQKEHSLDSLKAAGLYVQRKQGWGFLYWSPLLLLPCFNKNGGFPIYVEGHFRKQDRKGNLKSLALKNTRKPLWGLQNIKNEETAIMEEGIINGMSMTLKRQKLNVVAALGAANFNDSHIEGLTHLKKLIVMAHNDDAGLGFASKVQATFASHSPQTKIEKRVYSEVNDANDLLTGVYHG